MKNGEFRIKIAIIAALIAFMGLFGTYKLYNIYNVEKPLVNSIKSIPEVEQISLNKVRGQYEIYVKLAQVVNLQEKYQQIDSAAEMKLGAETYEIKIEDNQNASLKEFYDYTQLALLQAGTDNQYLWLNQTLQEKAGSAGITCSLLVDRDRVYIQARDGKSYMYIIVPHSNTETAPERERVS